MCANSILSYFQPFSQIYTGSSATPSSPLSSAPASAPPIPSNATPTQLSSTNGSSSRFNYDRAATNQNPVNDPTTTPQPSSPLSLGRNGQVGGAINGGGGGVKTPSFQRLVSLESPRPPPSALIQVSN